MRAYFQGPRSVLQPLFDEESSSPLTFDQQVDLVDADNTLMSPWSPGRDFQAHDLELGNLMDFFEGSNFDDEIENIILTPQPTPRGSLKLVDDRSSDSVVDESTATAGPPVATATPLANRSDTALVVTTMQPTLPQLRKKARRLSLTPIFNVDISAVFQRDQYEIACPEICCDNEVLCAAIAINDSYGDEEMSPLSSQVNTKPKCHECRVDNRLKSLLLVKVFTVIPTSPTSYGPMHNLTGAVCRMRHVASTGTTFIAAGNTVYSLDHASNSMVRRLNAPAQLRDICVGRRWLAYGGYGRSAHIHDLSTRKIIRSFKVRLVTQ